MHKPPLNILTASALIAGMISFSLTSQADTVTSIADGNWTNNATWDQVPVSGDTVNINHAVSNDFGGGYLNGVYTIEVNGSLTSPDIFRVNGSTINVNSSGTFGGGGFGVDLDDGTLSFDSGASLAIAGSWEQKDTNAFTFNLDSSGFTTMTAGTFRIGTGVLAPSITNASYTVDMTAYAGGTDVITLLDFTTDGYGMNNTIFQTAGSAVGGTGLTVTSAAGYTANIQWNDTTEAIELNITAVPEPSAVTLLGGSFALGVALLRRRRS